MTEPKANEKARILSDLQGWLRTLAPDVRAVVVETIKRERYRQDYATFAEDVLLADDNGRRGELNLLQKKVLGLPGNGRLVAVCARQL